MRATFRRLSIALVFAASPALAASDGSTMSRYMGEISCGSWPKDEVYGQIDKAVRLNWILGSLSRASFAHKIDLLETVDQASVSAWVDNYCRAHPLETQIDAAWALERELAQRAAEVHR